jgi:hypothetical protein
MQVKLQIPFAKRDKHLLASIKPLTYGLTLGKNR